MTRHFFMGLPLGLMILALTACDGGGKRGSKDHPHDGTSSSSQSPLFQPVNAPVPYPVPGTRQRVVVDLIIVPDARLVVIDRQDVPSRYDGVLEEIRVKEGQQVKAGEALGKLDDRVAAAEVKINEAKIAAAVAEVDTATRTKNESHQLWQTQVRLRKTTSTSEEEVRKAKLTYDKSFSEEISKSKAVELASKEREKSAVALELHVLRSKKAGRVKAILKHEGESVKTLEPVFQIENTGRLRVEAMVDLQFLPYLREGMTVEIEPTVTQASAQALRGHFADVTRVAVSNDLKEPAIVSASEDGTVRVWDRAGGREKRVFHHPAAVRAVACTPVGAAGNLCLSGDAQGKARLWNLASASQEPLRELQGQHRGPISCVAFSADGKVCATGGEDRDIKLWDVASGAALPHQFTPRHRGAVTALQFTPQGQLVSAARDNTLRLWSLTAANAKLEKTFDRRSGDVARPGVSPDGKRVLFDMGKSIRILSLPDGLHEGTLQNLSAGSNFTTFATFSPDGRMVLTAGANEGRLQLWHAPPGTRRAHEIRQFVGAERSLPTCAAFSPDGSFAVTGTRDHQVLVWPVPPVEELDRRYTAQIVFVEGGVEGSSSRQLRVWAELPNPDDRLIPGTTATMIIRPGASPK